MSRKILINYAAIYLAAIAMFFQGCANPNIKHSNVTVYANDAVVFNKYSYALDPTTKAKSEPILSVIEQKAEALDNSDLADVNCGHL